eukprot:TRINITY_DN1473_c0_g1_i1.p1 TRINITY_DN1473_c0_g1~~TRINITY_DN1473_c0_g1_i1.p1  ORF type:complete len:449 (+),score=50.39 TRINITY_DN1473_c0_g1_i1:48-1394(+)
MSLKLLSAVALLCFLQPCEGKGAGYRSYKSGYYSRSRFYGYGGIYLWGGGYRGSRSTSRSSTNPKALGITDKDVFCKRDVRLDHLSYTTPQKVTINSTRHCYQQVTPTHGSPYNVDINASWMDVYQWELAAGTGVIPSVSMLQYDDKDIKTPNSNSPLKVLVTKIKEENTTHSIDLSTLTWQATRQAPVGKPIWGYPFAYAKDEAKMMTFSTRGVSSSGDIDVVLTFTAAGDFAEDAYDDHTFIRPSGLRVDMTVTKFPFQGVKNSIGVEFIIVSAKNRHSVGTPISTKFGTEYDPRAMNRVEIGSPLDAEKRGRHFFSWKGTTNLRSMCASKLSPNCAHLDSSLTGCKEVVTVAGLCPICANKGSPECQALDVPQNGTASRMTVWSLNSNSRLYENTTSPFSKTNYLSWAFTVGTWDSAEHIAPTEGAFLAMPSLYLLLGSVLIILC